MTNDDCLLTGHDVLMLIEALDAFIPPQGGNAWGMRPPMSDEEKQRFGPFGDLRLRMSRHVGMGFYDKGRTFLDNALRQERYDLTQALHSKMSELLKQPSLTRREFRQGMVKAIQELRDVRFFKVKMPD